MTERERREALRSAIVDALLGYCNAGGDRAAALGIAARTLASFAAQQNAEELVSRLFEWGQVAGERMIASQATKRKTRRIARRR
jgi:hypothetical protein